MQMATIIIIIFEWKKAEPIYPYLRDIQTLKIGLLLSRNFDDF